MAIKRQPKPVYSFLEDLVPTENIKQRRKCLGYSVSCNKYVTGFKNNRLCPHCKYRNFSKFNPGAVNATDDLVENKACN